MTINDTIEFLQGLVNKEPAVGSWRILAQLEYAPTFEINHLILMPDYSGILFRKDAPEKKEKKARK